MKPYAASCDENREPILVVLNDLLHDYQSLLEIGSGTGQHAVYFGEQFPRLTWQTSDQLEYHAGIKAWLQDAKLANVLDPLLLDVRQVTWPNLTVDAVFSANTLHIMSWEAVQACFAGVGRLLISNGLFIVYGPFNYAGQFTSTSNARFDQWLKQRDPDSGIRNFEDLNLLAAKAGMELQADYEMPVNNRILVWRKTRTTIG
ncbi:DUF938 domain-containing protein [uncultured Thiothrix sp.]|uniref:DUF938 domain-containing protein n=1 Tax=uncultured Thiothrix sp. TaxID=223185 RepID=UPI00261127A9|nr:DUF938 domain-containing protein [uncultured Thiothrix sp.]HMT92799.1 DUF938 domain-containing protein [Thiolinea sp.]